MSVATRIRAALRGGRRLTANELVDELRVSRNAVMSALRDSALFVRVGQAKAVGGAHGGGRASLLWALAGTAPAYSWPTAQPLGPPGPLRSDIPDSEGVSDDSEEGRSLPTQAAPSQWVLFEPSSEVAACPSMGPVKLADCIDNYVDATACERGTPCDGCPIGRQRRADYAGADFEDASESFDPNDIEDMAR